MYHLTTVEGTLEVWKSLVARSYYWWRPNRRHYAFTPPKQ